MASENGVSVTYGLNNAQERGLLFIGPGVQVYEGMIVGTIQRSRDIAVNVCKEKKMTNIRSSTSDIAIKLTPPILFSLEQSIDFINRDELVEITPEHIRLRKKILQETMRLREISSTRRMKRKRTKITNNARERHPKEFFQPSFYVASLTLPMIRL